MAVGDLGTRLVYERFQQWDFTGKILVFLIGGRIREVVANRGSTVGFFFLALKSRHEMNGQQV